MNFNNILSFLTPKDVKFYPLLTEVAEIVDKTAELLPDLFAATDNEQVKKISRLIKLQENNGDRVTGNIFKALNETFITPFDREDITALTDEMDDVIDIINRVAQKVVLFQPETLPPATLDMAVTIRKGGAEIKAAVAELSKLKKSDKQINIHLKEIKRLEEEADRIYEKGTSDLFRSNIKPEELFKLKEIIQELEKSANRINSVGKILKTVVVKYT